MSYIFTDSQRIREIKSKIATDKRLKRELEYLAEKYMAQEPLSVTFNKSPAESGNIHDYYSEDPYWWPDPENPEGPYIRRDGYVNPNYFSAHREDINKMCEAVCVLAQAGLFLEDDCYYSKAIELLKVWFLEEKTKMNPHLEYGQAIRGICSGRGLGIVDTATLIKVINAANIIEEAGLYKEEINALKNWFREYTHWLNTSEKGLFEKNYFNNHSNFWNTQVAAFCAFTGNDELLEECFDKYKQDILNNQLDSEGRFTDELTRTCSYSYFMGNMEGCAILCEIAYYKGIDLWNSEAPNGNSFKKCVEFFKPFYENPFLWEYDQIKASGCFRENIALKLAARRFNDEELEAINIKRRKDSIPCIQITHIGLLDLI